MHIQLKNDLCKSIFAESRSQQYDVTGLIKMCDESSTLLIPTNEVVFGSCVLPFNMNFFIRTFNTNCFVKAKKGEIVFKPNLDFKEAVTLNDAMLLTAREVARRVFKDQPVPLIGMNCVPTPFGVRIRYGIVETMIQLCYNDNSNLKLSEDYELVPFGDCKNSEDEQLQRIFKTLIYVKEKNYDE